MQFQLDIYIYIATLYNLFYLIPYGRWHLLKYLSSFHTAYKGWINSSTIDLRLFGLQFDRLRFSEMSGAERFPKTSRHLKTSQLFLVFRWGTPHKFGTPHGRPWIPLSLTLSSDQSLASKTAAQANAHCAPRSQAFMAAPNATAMPQLQSKWLDFATHFTFSRFRMSFFVIQSQIASGFKNWIIWITLPVDAVVASCLLHHRSLSLPPRPLAPAPRHWATARRWRRPRWRRSGPPRCSRPSVGPSGDEPRPSATGDPGGLKFKWFETDWNRLKHQRYWRWLMNILKMIDDIDDCIFLSFFGVVLIFGRWRAGLGGHRLQPSNSPKEQFGVSLVFPVSKLKQKSEHPQWLNVYRHFGSWKRTPSLHIPLTSIHG